VAASLALAPLAVSAGGIGTLAVNPTDETVAGGAPFSIDIVQKAGVATSQVQTDLTFDPSLVQLQEIKAGPAWTGSVFAFGNDAATAADAIAGANQNGTVTITVLATGKSVSAGETTFVTLRFAAVSGPGGRSELRLRNATMADAATQATFPVILTSGSVTITPGGGSVSSPIASGSITPSLPPCPSATPAESGTASPLPSAMKPGPKGSAKPTVQPSAAPCATPAPTPAPSPTPAGPATVTLYLVTDHDTVAVGDTITATILENSDNPLSSVTFDVGFDHSLLQVVSVDAATTWQGATLIPSRPSVVQAAIDRANSAILDVNYPNEGVLQGIGINVPAEVGDVSVSGSLLTVTLKAIRTGNVDIQVTPVDATDATGVTEQMVGSSAAVMIATSTGGAGGGGATGGKGLDVDWVLLVSASVLFVELLACVVVMLLPARTLRSGVRLRLPSWPFVVSLLLGLIPVGLFAGLVGLIVVNSLPALTSPGIAALFDDHFSGHVYSNATSGAFGLAPAVAGTVLIGIVAMTIALPVSLALAIVTTEFPMGPLGRVLRPVVGLLSGIPPIIYAVSMVAFVRILIIPKFTADSTFATFNGGAAIGVDPSTWPPAGIPSGGLPGLFPWDLTGMVGCTFLAGLLISLLVIPFITPMIADAIRNAPTSTREASLALGASRAYTLRHAILPRALPAILSAVVLGLLKAVGDVAIVTFAAGAEADTIPNPIFDIFEHTPSLAAHGANMIVPFTQLSTGMVTQSSAANTAVGYVCALLLLALAVAMILILNSLQARWRRSLAG
jgi:phosphate transport system permease protein